MRISDFERLLAAALPARGRLAITLTDLPADEDLPDMLDRAIVAGESCGAPLVEVHAPLSRFGLDGAWRHAVVRQAGDVLRLVFEGEGAPTMPLSVQPEFRSR